MILVQRVLKQVEHVSPESGREFAYRAEGFLFGESGRCLWVGGLRFGGMGWERLLMWLLGAPLTRTRVLLRPVLFVWYMNRDFSSGFSIDGILDLRASSRQLIP